MQVKRGSLFYALKAHLVHFENMFCYFLVRGGRPYTALGPDTALFRCDLEADRDHEDLGGGVRGAHSAPGQGRVHDLPLARVREDRLRMPFA